MRIRIRDPESFLPCDPGWKNPDPGFGIRDKHPGAATLNITLKTMLESTVLFITAQNK
jgi:hypothetical protein